MDVPPTARLPADLDEESVRWLTVLRSSGAAQDAAVAALHGRLMRVARREAARRALSFSGPELADIATQAAGDATVAILGKLDEFRGESRFTTWAYRFVVLEVSAKLGRHHWLRHRGDSTVEEWDRLPDRINAGPVDLAEAQDLVAAVHRAVEETLTAHQRRLFVDVVVRGLPLDAIVARDATTRNAVYKVVFDARRKIRGFLAAHGYLDESEEGR